jgi:hypothetical protein
MALFERCQLQLGARKCVALLTGIVEGTASAEFVSESEQDSSHGCLLGCAQCRRVMWQADLRRITGKRTADDDGLTRVIDRPVKSAATLDRCGAN